MTGATVGIVLATIALIALSAFFVAVEFALIGSKRHRLEEAAEHSRAARAALRNASELTLLLAGAQLGITLCALGLGALTKPAVHDWLMPALGAAGLPEVTADVVAFALALFIVTFLHLVIGEMAPKSWAITHPEKSAIVLSLPMRGFLRVTRLPLRALNQAANWMLARVGVNPVDAVLTGQDPDGLRHLVEHSVNVGALDVGYSAQISGALEMQEDTVRSLVRRGRGLTVVPPDATVGDVQDATRRTGHLRVLMGTDGHIDRVVHVRDTLMHPLGANAAQFARPVFTIPAATTLHAALATMRRTRNHLVLVTDRGGVLGVMTLADVLARLLPPAAAAR
jgi:CBS domain containing-hemolysin-like protein